MLIFYIVYPLILCLIIIILFVKVFAKYFYPFADKLKLSSHIVLLFSIIVFYTLLSLWLVLGIKIFGSFSFTVFVYFTGIFTALSYPIADKSLMTIWLRKSVFILSIIPWLSIAILTSPIFSMMIKPYGIGETFGFGKEIIFENKNYRIEKYSRMYSAGDQYYFDIVTKNCFYESSKHTWGYREEIESSHIQKLIGKSAEIQANKAKR